MVEEVGGHPTGARLVGVGCVVEDEAAEDVAVDRSLEVGQVSVAHRGWRTVLDDAEGIDHGVGLFTGENGVVAVIEDVDVSGERGELLLKLLAGVAGGGGWVEPAWVVDETDDLDGGRCQQKDLAELRCT